MIYQAKKYVRATLLSLVALAISLPMYVMAAVAPTVTALPTFHEAGGLPLSIAIAPDGSMYVSNYTGGAINQISPVGKFIRKVSKQYIVATSIAFAQDGTLLAATSDSVVRMALDGTVLGTLPKMFVSPTSITLDDLGYIYVVDYFSCAVFVYSPDGQYVRQFGSKGSAPGQLLQPISIVFDKVNRQLIVAEEFNNRFQFFDLNGNSIKSFGTVAAVLGRTILPMEFHSPRSIAIEYTKEQPQLVNRLYALDRMQNLIQVIDPVTLSPLIFPGKIDNFIGVTFGYTDGLFFSPYSTLFDQVNGRLLVASEAGITVYGIDGGSNPVDTTPPTVTIDAILATVAAPSVVVTGTVEAGASVIVSLSSVILPVEMTSTTTWKAVVTPLVPGTNNISVTAKDSAGNVTQPQVVSTSYILPAPVLAVATIPSITNATSTIISGTVDAGSNVKVKNNATQAEGDAIVTGTTWTYTATLAEGVNALSISAKAANTQTAVKESVITLDSVAPKMSVSALSTGSITSSQVQNIAGTVADASQIAVLVNNLPVDVIAGAFSTAVTLNEGQNQITVIAADAAGNTAQDVRTITFDGTKPVITIADSTLPDNTTTNTALYQIAGSISEAAQITVAGSAVVVDAATNNWSTAVTLLPGDNTIEVVATDAVGNTSSVKRTVTYSVAKVDLAISSPAQDFATNKKYVKFNGTVTDNSAIEISYSVNNGTSVPVVATAGKYSFKVSLKDEGTYSIAITAKDPSGVSTTTVRNVIFDTTPPIFNLNKKTSTSKKLFGTVEAGATITDLSKHNVPGLTVSGTHWTLDTNNHKNIDDQLKATDAAGNESFLK